jgi:hypothetical protein
MIDNRGTRNLAGEIIENNTLGCGSRNTRDNDADTGPSKTRNVTQEMVQ